MKTKYALMAMLSAAAFSSCELDEKFYSSVTPDTFITSPENTYAILGRPFTHTKWYMAGERWWSQELTTDELVCPTRGTDFYNDGMYIRPHQHTMDCHRPYGRAVLQRHCRRRGPLLRGL